MEVIAEYGNEDLAKVYIARMRGSDKHRIEFVESLQPPRPRSEKWVIIISSLFGCPVNCLMCDAGGGYMGKLSVDEILEQVGYVIKRRYPDGHPETGMLKVQFARIGEPAYNPDVLKALAKLAQIYGHQLHAAVSTIAPSAPQTWEFFKSLIEIKNRYYSGGRFQLQFSIHTTDEEKRNNLIPAAKLSFKDMAEYGSMFSNPERGDKKVTLNFAPVSGYSVDASVIARYFSPEKFIIKLTPLNPTIRSSINMLKPSISPDKDQKSTMLLNSFKNEGYDVILSIGEVEENKIGSNCGQYIQRALASKTIPQDGYELDRYKHVGAVDKLT